MMTQTTFLVTEHNLSKFEWKLNKAAQTGEKFGLCVREVSRSREFRSVGNSGYETAQKELVWRITVEHPVTLAVRGWRVIGLFEKFTDNQFLYYPMETKEPDQKVIEETMARLQAENSVPCDHCQKKRVRNHVFLLANEKGEYKIAASQCVKEYTGIDPIALLFVAKLIDELEIADEDKLKEPSVGGSHFDVITYVADVIFCVEYSKRFISAKQAKEGVAPFATWQMATNIPYFYSEPEEIRAWTCSAEARKEKARNALFWITQQKNESGDTFWYNARAIADAALQNEVMRLSDRSLATLAAGVNIYMRAQEAKTQQKENNKTTTSEHIGTPGEKMTIHVRFVRAIEKEGFRSQRTWLHFFSDEHGNTFSWQTNNTFSAIKTDRAKPQYFSGPVFPRDIVLPITCTIKNHWESKTGEKVTGLVRVHMDLDDDTTLAAMMLGMLEHNETRAIDELMHVLQQESTYFALARRCQRIAEGTETTDNAILSEIAQRGKNYWPNLIENLEAVHIAA